MFDSLTSRGYQVQFECHARAILGADFPSAIAELEDALVRATIPIEEIVAGGGGEARGTQRLRRALAAKGWRKMNFKVEKRINDVPRESQSHEVDHVREFEVDGRLARIALEIEWNNKDPFFDRDLENFKRLHADGAISAGVIVTRGRSLHQNMRAMVGQFVDERQIRNLSDLERWGYNPTRRQRKAIEERVARSAATNPLRDAFVSVFVADKFGEATTHWAKLEDRIARGVGNPCPLVLIGLPDSIVTFHEGQAALAEVEAAEAADEGVDAAGSAADEAGATSPATSKRPDAGTLRGVSRRTAAPVFDLFAGSGALLQRVLSSPRLVGSPDTIDAETLREILRSEMGSITATDTLVASPPYTRQPAGGDQRGSAEALLDFYVTRFLEMLREDRRLVVATSSAARRKVSRR